MCYLLFVSFVKSQSCRIQSFYVFVLGCEFWHSCWLPKSSITSDRLRRMENKARNKTQALWHHRLVSLNHSKWSGTGVGISFTTVLIALAFYVGPYKYAVFCFYFNMSHLHFPCLHQSLWQWRTTYAYKGNFWTINLYKDRVKQK